MLIRLPFNWKSPFGYALLIIFLIQSAFVELSVIVPTVCLAVGSICLVSFLNGMIYDELVAFNESMARRKMNRNKTHKLLYDIIQDSAESKQFRVQQCFIFCISMQQHRQKRTFRFLFSDLLAHSMASWLLTYRFCFCGRFSLCRFVCLPWISN